MNKMECERKLLGLIAQAEEIYRQYNPAGGEILLSGGKGGRFIRDNVFDAHGQFIGSTIDAYYTSGKVTRADSRWEIRDGKPERVDSYKEQLLGV